ncbi:MAG: ABC transporter ATP-binding protein [Lautropia sp.]
MLDRQSRGDGKVSDAVDTILKVEDLTVSFAREGESIAAVNGVSFTLARGDTLCVLGESGSGKSVMLKALIRLLPGYASIGGRIELDGEDVIRAEASQLRRIRGKRIGMIFQEPSIAFDPVFTVGDQICEVITTHLGLDRKAAERRAVELLDMVAIPSPARRLTSYPHELSGGMRQRAMIAMALACRPDILLADEPTTALDVTVQMQLLLLLRELQRELNMAIVFVTHNVGVAAEIASRVGVMYAGRFVETGSAADVLIAPKHPYSAGLLASTVHAGMRGRDLDVIAGSPPDLARLPPGCSFAPRCKLVAPRCVEEMPAERILGRDQAVRCFFAK